MEQVRNDMQDYREYLIDPDDIVEILIDETVKEVHAKVKDKLEKVVMERAMNKLGLEE